MVQLENAVNYFKYLILDDIKDVNCWVAGGSVRKYFSNEKGTTDIDIFFPNKKEWEKAKNILNDNSKLVFENNKTYKIKYKKYYVDLVKTFFSDPNECIKNFDFTVCSAAVDKDTVYYHPTFFIDLAKKVLVINSLPYPISTLQRLQKYILKGYIACNGTLLEIAKAINNLDLDDPKQNNIEFYPNGDVRFIRFD